jgi:Protein of unknown function (DUF2508).
MNMENVLGILSDRMGSKSAEAQLLKDIEETIIQIKDARQLFESVSSPSLVDCAIYMEEAAKARYSFLLAEAKRLNIRTNHDNILIESRVV